MLCHYSTFSTTVPLSGKCSASEELKGICQEPESDGEPVFKEALPLNEEV